MWTDNAEYRCLISILRCALHKLSPESELFQRVDMDRLFNVCKQHHLISIVSPFINSADDADVDKETKQRFFNEAKVKNGINLLYELEKRDVFQMLDNERIRYLPLKGSVLRQYYPEPNQRLMSDIDLFIDEENADRVHELMLAAGFECKSFDDTHHDVYYKKPVTFEIHRKLSYRFDDKWDTYYQTISEKLIRKNEDGYEYAFTPEDCYVYVFMHGYRHFVSNGIGIKFLLDLYLLITSNSLNWEYIESQLKILGVVNEEAVFRKIAIKLFSSDIAEADRIMTELENDIVMIVFCSGAYGNRVAGVMQRINRFGINKDDKNLKLKYGFSRFMNLPYAYSYEFPRLYKNPFGRVIIRIIRTARAVTLRRKKTTEEWKLLKQKQKNNTNP